MRLIGLSILVISLLLVSSALWANEAIITSVLLNEEKKEDLFVIKTDDGDFLIKPEDMDSMGLLPPKAVTTDVDGEKYVSLRSIAGVVFSFDEQDIILKITALPEMFPKKTIDFTPQRQRDVYFPSDTSAFLNYGVDYTGNENNEQRNLTVSNELGFRIKDFLVFSDSAYTYTNAENRFARLMTNLTYDRRKDLTRGTAGDFFASSPSILGSTLNMCGLSYAKRYGMDPYFVKYPMIDMRGVVMAPSEVEIYRNGVRIGRERLSPGEFELRDVASYGGAGVLETVIRDPFGREQRFSEPYYFTNILLREGLHEYSYNAGFLRNEYGVKSADYGSPALSAFHKYGLYHWLTVGGNAEAGNGRYNLGPQAALLLKRFGTLTASAAASLDDDDWKKGAAGSLVYEYQGRVVNAWMYLNGYTIDYLNISSSTAPPRTKLETGGGAGYTTMKFGSVSLDISDTERYDAASRLLVGSASYSRSLGRNFFASVTYRVSNENDVTHEIFAGLTYYPGKDITLSGNYQKSGSSQTGTLQVQKNPPYGEGLGYRASVQKTENAYVIDPSVQYNSSFGIHRGEYIGTFNGGANNSFEVSTAGSVAYVDKTLNLTRPVNDSFGLVKIDGVKDVGVYVSNQKIAATNKAGKAFIPDLNSYYDNQISIDAGAVPIDYDIEEAVRFVSPPYRSGSLIEFKVAKLQAVTGILNLRSTEGVTPLEFYEITAVAEDGSETVFPTGRGGEFYAEKLGPGKYTASFEMDDKKREFEFTVPDTGEPIIDLGEIVYYEKPERGKRRR